MKKEDLSSAVTEIRKLLNSDLIVNKSAACITGRAYNECAGYRDQIVGWVVNGKGHFDRFTTLQLNVASQLQLDSIYLNDIHSKWIPYWSKSPGFNTNDVSPYTNYLKDYHSTIFIEAHRRIIAIDDLLSKNLHTKQSDDQFIAEVITDDSDPSIEDVEITLRLLRELAKAYCTAICPDEGASIRVSYLDMGSNYQVGIKVDAKAEIGVNLTKFLTQILKFITNPRAFIKTLSIETQLQKVDAIAAIQKRVSAGEITNQAGDLLVRELLGTAQRLSSHSVFPASLVKETEEASTVREYRSLLTETAFQVFLPEVKLSLPDKKPSNGLSGDSIA